MIRVAAAPVIERGSIELWQLAVLLIRAKCERIDAMRELDADDAEVTMSENVSNKEYRR